MERLEKRRIDTTDDKIYLIRFIPAHRFIPGFQRHLASHYYACRKKPSTSRFGHLQELDIRKKNLLIE